MTTTWRYTGGLPVEMELASGRVLSIAPGETVDALPSEREIFAVRSDFESVKPAEKAAEPKETDR